MKIYIIAGKAKSGKDLLGKFMKEYYDKKGQSACIMHFASPLYDYAKNYFSWNGNMSSKPREFLQSFGIEYIQEKLGKKTFLVDRLCEDIEILKEFFRVFIITDGRLISEFNLMKERFADVKIIKIESEDIENGLTEKEKEHITENDFLSYSSFDYTVKNKKNCDLREIAKNIIEERENNEEGEVL